VTAALQARELQAEVTLLESKRVGGTSIDEGPAPARTLARAARLARDAGSWETFGLKGARPEIDDECLGVKVEHTFSRDAMHNTASLQHDRG
jgi:pyruvate/2-oxoglutarate dehydrogenase complex dihydrolipoamide dehydrogenase (E3) component